MTRRLLALLPLLGGCAVATPFRAARDAPGAEETAIVAVTHATLKPTDGAFRRFLAASGTVAESLPDQPGYLGHSLRVGLLGTELWTLTAWTDAAALALFIDSDAHQAGIRAASPVLAHARFARFEVPRTGLPPRWATALAALEAPGARRYAFG
jgi:heme-degrading monooxygenase HmoA